MVHGHCTNEVVEWALNNADLSNLIGVPMSRHEGRLTGKGTIEKNAIAPDPHLFRCAHFTCYNRSPLCLSTWMSTWRCCLETILGAMNHGYQVNT
jgi:hypothetical protein